MIRIAIFSSVLVSAGDEGVRNFVQGVSQAWQGRGHAVTLLGFGEPHGTTGQPRFVKPDPWLVSAAFRRELTAARPDIIFYFPNASLNVLSALRSRRLVAVCPGARLVMVALQPSSHVRWQRPIIARLQTLRALFVQSRQTQAAWHGVCPQVHLLPSGVNRQRFYPALPGQKASLRQKYGVPEGGPVVLHVGHIRPTRNVQSLLPLQTSGRAQIVLVGSSSTPQDESLCRRSEAAGAMVIRHYLQHIEELYRLADCYVFPVVSPYAAIEFPLSVLEALASGLPVVSTPFGALPDFLSRESGIIFTDASSLMDAVRDLLAGPPVPVPVLPPLFDWEAIAERLLTAVS